MRTAPFLVVLLVLQVFLTVDAWWKKPKSSCPKRAGAKPYYFGTTDLFCMSKGSKKGKRSAPSRSTIRLIHRFIYYDGYYFEFGIGKKDLAVYDTTAVASDRCKSRKEKKPAGFSKLPVDCLKRCTEKYKSKYGDYNLLWHNCHVFANRISKILCTATRCPSWCG